MPAKRTDDYLSKGKQFWLSLSVHADALMREPRAYLTACWWRLRGKRVRSRNQMAPLLGASRRAYDLWLLNEPILTQHDTDIELGPPIVSLVDATISDIGLNQTLRSLADEQIPALVVGSSATPSLGDAVQQINWDDAPWIMPLRAGDRLKSGSAAAYRSAITEGGSHLIYADDDLLNEAGQRSTPHFKPDWNSELFQHFDYLSGACVLRVSPEKLESVDGQSDWPGQLIARTAAQGIPHHIRTILHSRCRRPQPMVPAGAPPTLQRFPTVSVIVPTRNRVDLLRTCLEGVASAQYPHIEVLVVDNDSDDPATLDYLRTLEPVRHRVLHYPGTFNFSAINNFAVREAQGQLLCLLNNDVEMIEPNWLSLMVSQALRDDVGAVGARLLYPDGRIQHAGVVIGMGNAAGHGHRFVGPKDEGYFRRHELPQFVSAVTGACLVVSKERFLAVGGLDENNFPVAFNDVDLCMRLNERGWQSFYEPRATLIHHESVSRGFDRDPIGAARFAFELEALKRSWNTDVIVDPFHHPDLSRATEQFVVRL